MRVGCASEKSCGAAATQSRKGRQTWHRPAPCRCPGTASRRRACCRPERCLLAPAGIEEAVGVERDEPRDEAAERRIRARVDRRVDDTEEFRQLVRAQREPGHHAEAAAAAALQRPEEIRIRAGIGDAHPAIGGDDFGLQQRRRGHAVALRKAAEAAALDQAGDADRSAASALDIAARFGDDRVISAHPDVAGLDSDRRLRRLRPAHPSPTNASCIVIPFIARVQISSEPAAFDVPW